MFEVPMLERYFWPIWMTDQKHWSMISLLLGYIPMKTKKKRSASSAFTLIEMVLVLAIVALLVGAGIVHLRGVLASGKEKRVLGDINTLTAALRTYELDNLSAPTTGQGLKALVEPPSQQPRRWKQYLAKMLVDPWNNEYQYRNPGEKNRGSFDIYSWGPDGVESDDDIGNWDQ